MSRKIQDPDSFTDSFLKGKAQDRVPRKQRTCPFPELAQRISQQFRRILPFFQSLMASHDIVAQRDYLPKLGDIPFEVDEDEDTIKIVQLVKSQDGTVSQNGTRLDFSFVN